MTGRGSGWTGDKTRGQMRTPKKAKGAAPKFSLPFDLWATPPVEQLVLLSLSEKSGWIRMIPWPKSRRKTRTLKQQRVRHPNSPYRSTCGHPPHFSLLDRTNSGSIVENNSQLFLVEGWDSYFWRVDGWHTLGLHRGVFLRYEW